MRAITTILFLLFEILFAEVSNAQTTIILQPDSCQGKDAGIGDCIPCGYYNTNYGSTDELSAMAWTNGGNPSNGRGMIQFDLSNIPSTATVTSAYLSLYYNPNPSSGNIGHSQISGSNQAWLQRITSAWTEYGVTWANQPTTTIQNEVTLPASTSATQDYPNIDVTALVQDMVSNPAQSFGFMLRLQTESYYRSLLFASSDHPNAALHPKLELCYVVPSGINDLTDGSTFTISPNPFTNSTVLTINTTVKDAEVTIYTILGKEVLKKKITGKKIEIEKGNLAVGAYFVKVYDGKKQYCKKLIVE